jgi:hypothetical protein
VGNERKQAKLLVENEKKGGGLEVLRMKKEN